MHIRWSLGLWAVLAALAAGSALLPATARAQAPNVLIVVTDDQRAGDTLSVMPETRRHFARNGTRYPNAFAATPLCCPSRATILTGRYAHNTGVLNNTHARRLDPATVFARLLRDSGYQTALAGKFLNSWPASSPPPHFDRYALFPGGKADYTDPLINVSGSLARHRGYSTTLVRQYSLRFLRRFERKDDRPWLLYVAPSAPHAPARAERKYAHAAVPRWSGNPAVFETDRRDKPPFIRSLRSTFRDGRAVRTRQLRTLMSVDDMIGRIFGSLADLGERRDTLAFFLSDNGFIWADHRIGGGGRPGQKRLPYTASIKIPLLVRWPGHVARDATDARLTGTVDIARTVLDAAGVAPDPAQPALDGRSLLRPNVRDRLLLEYWRLGNGLFPTWASTRTAAFQYTEYYEDDGETTSFREYYDLRRDPWQLHNLLGDSDLSNDPNLEPLEARLAADRACVGTQGSRACP